MSTHFWFSNELCWKIRQEQEWILQDPPRPQWAQNQDDVPPKKFIEVWVGAASLNDIKKHFFWRSIEDLCEQYVGLSVFLQENGYEPLPERTLRENELLNPQELAELEEARQGSSLRPNPRTLKPSDRPGEDKVSDKKGITLNRRKGKTSNIRRS